MGHAGYSPSSRPRPTVVAVPLQTTEAQLASRALQELVEREGGSPSPAATAPSIEFYRRRDEIDLLLAITT